MMIHRPCFAYFLAIGSALSVCAQGPVVDLRFEGNAGTTAKDSSGKGLDGYFHTRDSARKASDYVSRVEGKIGKGIQFNGQGENTNNNGCVVVKVTDKFDFTNGMTIEMWINPNEIGTKAEDKHELASNMLAGHGPGFRLTLVRARGTLGPIDSIRFGSGDGENFWQANSRWIGDATPIKSGNWYHVVGVYDGDRFFVFINGEEAAHSKEGLKLTKGTDQISIGSFNKAYRFGFNGIIDDVKFYDYAVTADDIKTSATAQ